MSRNLIIRHLCGELDASERVHFLKYFGAQKVWFINPKSHTAFASFVSEEAAESALYRLHQMEVLGKRLTVEYARENSTNCRVIEDVTTNTDRTKGQFVKDFINQLNGINPSVNFHQPPPPNMRYEYPKATSGILFNIIYSLAKDVQFYVQTLHLMNKMGLDPPFTDLCEDTKRFIEKCLEDVGYNATNSTKSKNDLSSQESEISTEEDSQIDAPVPIAKPIKRKSKLSKINKKIKSQLKSIGMQQSKSKILSTEEMFENATVVKAKKIEINVAISEPNLNKKEAEVVGFIGKMVIPEVKEELTQVETEISESDNAISTKELLTNKVSIQDMKILPVFKNYTPGTPSLRLYIKNLAKSITVKDIEGIYQRYVTTDNQEEAKIFDIRVMQEGRMKGQAFVTLPSVEISQRALNETNGFIIKDKPMVVQFARTANK